MSAGSRPWWRRRASLLGLGACVAVAVGAWRWQPPVVDAVQPHAQALLRTLQFTGRVKTPARVEVGVTQTGRVAAVKVQEGQAIEAGQVLIELETDEWRASAEQARAALAQADARLNSQQGGTLPNARASLAQAEATLHNAEAELARTQALVARQFYSQSKLDDATRAVAVARAQRDAAQVQVQVNQPNGAEQHAAQAQVATSRAALSVAEAKLAQAYIRAPGAGRVLARNVEPGQIVQAGKGLLTLSIKGPTELVAQVDERFLAQLAPGQQAQVRADAFPGQPFAARLDRLAPAVDAQSGSVEVTFVVDQAAPAFLREDMTLSIEVRTGERQAALALPLRAFRGLDNATADRATVLVADNGRAVSRAVRLGLRTLSAAEVREGLQDRDWVLLDPAIEPGQRVRPRAASPERLAQSGADGQGVAAMSSSFGK